MAKSSISADIKAANSKLARFIRSLEEEDMLLQIGKRKPLKLEQEGRLFKGLSRWTAPVDYTVPTCLVDRPLTGSGATSFHFKFTHVKREAFPMIDGVPLDTADKRNQPALDHSIYIEREGAPEVVEGAKHARYIEREGAVEFVKSDDQGRSSNQRTPTNPDGEEPLLGEEFGLAEDGDRSPNLAVFSNISDDPFERQDYWRAIERTEREPKSHHLTFDPEVCEEWWAAIKHEKDLDPELKAHLLSVFDQYRRRVGSAASDADHEYFRAPEFPAPNAENKLDAESAGRLLKQARRVPGYDISNPPIQFKSGRGGRTQYRFVAGLPYEISAEDRVSIVKEFCARLEALEMRTDDSGVEHPVGMMYTAVIHAPDRHNDPRNYHLHIVAHDRPAKFMPEFGVWDFEVEVPYCSHRKWRMGFPYRQNKIGAISRAGNGADYSRSGRSFVAAMREDFAAIVNNIFEARGVERRYDPRSFAARGLDLAPTKHLGTRAAALEAIGVVTTVGQLNAITIWNDAERGIERQIEGLERDYKAHQDVIEAVVQEATSIDVRDPALEHARALASERRTLIGEIVDHQRSIKVFDHLEAKAKSRAKRTIRTCRAHLDDIKTGAADKSTVAMKSSVQARLDEAQQHLNTIDAALDCHRDDLDHARRTIQKDKERVASIDNEIRPVMAGVSELTRMATDKRKQNDADLREAEKARNAEKDKSAAIQLIETQAEASPPQPKRTGHEGSIPRKALPVCEASEQMDADVPAPGPNKVEKLPRTQSPIESSKDEAPAQRSTKNRAPTTNTTPPRQAVVDGGAAITPEVFNAASQSAEEKAQSAERGSSDKPRETDISAMDTAARSDHFEEAQAPPHRDQLHQKAGRPSRRGETTNGPKHVAWNDLMDRINRERIPIEVRETHSGRLAYHVPSLSEADQKTLKLRRFSYRTQPRLEKIFIDQERERSRLRQWIEKDARKSEKIKICDGKVELGNVRPAIRTLMRNWEAHPDIQKSISNLDAGPSKGASRAPIEVEEETTKAQTVHSDNRDRRTKLRGDAERKYPHPDDVKTKPVARYALLLRNLAPEDELREAAHEVFSSTLARRDVHQYGPELAKAYKDHSNGLPPSLLRQDRERKSRE